MAYTSIPNSCYNNNLLRYKSKSIAYITGELYYTDILYAWAFESSCSANYKLKLKNLQKVDIIQNITVKT